MFFSGFREINIFKGTSEYVGLKNYISIFKDGVFLKSFRNTVIYVVSVTAVLIPFSFLVSLLVDCCSRMGSFVRSVLYLPSIIAMSVAALMWRFLLASDIGLISRLLSNLGITMPNLLGDARYTLMTVVGLGVWRSLGSNTVLFIAGLKSMPREQLEAAEVDGATPLQSIIYIILPNIRYVTSFVTITTIIGCFQVFTTVQVFTQGGPNNSTNMLVYRIWQEGFRFFNIGNASTISTLMFLTLLGLAVIMVYILTKRGDSKK
jgi:sn-glycerol 3-phosphate transport system permease protein